MKQHYKLIVALVAAVCVCFSAFAQSNELIKQGVDLHNQGKYAEAIDKFNEVLKTDPENGYANYELAFSLYASKKPQDAIPHLEKATASSNASVSQGAYALLAAIYDEANETPKAIEVYNKVIKLNPDYPQIYYNIGLSYFRNKQYPEAEASAIEAIKHNPKNASSQRLYALVCFHQNQRKNALAALCSFLMIEPTGPRATEAFTNIQSILKGGVLKDNNGNPTIVLSTPDDKEAGAMNNMISLAVVAAQTKKLTGAALLEEELKSIFGISGQLSEKKTDKNFFDKFFIDYLYKLVQSGNLSAFAHTASLSVYKDEDAAWLKANPEKLHDLAEWIAKTERGF
jgi:tetratricopeptide (TPR) repeat protein